jgi:hypothetical protein
LSCYTFKRERPLWTGTRQDSWSSIAQALGSDALDRYTRAHLEEAAAHIDAALEASIQRSVGG